MVVFHNQIAGIFSNKILEAILTELFTCGRKLNFYCFYYLILFCSSKKYYNTE